MVVIPGMGFRNPDFAEDIIEELNDREKDIPINAGSVFSSCNPLSLGEYWTDNSFTKPVAKLIASFL